MLCFLAGFSSLAGGEGAPASPFETEIYYLSGRGPEDAVEWDFKVSEGRRSGEWTKIRVPSVWEQEGFGTYNYGIRYYGKPNPPAIAREQGVYRHSFHVPAEWQGRRVRLVFEGSMTDTHVRLNGISMGPAHQGGFYRFRHDVTQWLKFGGENQLEITVDKESANQSVNMAERRADYWNFGGIFRPVFLEVLPPRFIDRVALDARADGQFRAEVFLGEAKGSAAQRVTGQLLDADGQPVGAPFTADVRAGADRVTLRTQLPEPRQWTAETPQLYTARFTLAVASGEKGEGADPGAGGKGQGAGAVAAVGDRAAGAGSREQGAGVVAAVGDRGPGSATPATGGKDTAFRSVHVVEQRFGFRTFEIRPGEGLFLNGQRILLKGVNRHSFRPETGRTLSREDNYEDVRLIKELNMNAVRMSHYPPDPAFLEACDELGLYVINELGGWHGAYETGVGRTLVAEMVTRDVNHPSILFWANGNEGGWNTELDAEFARWDPSKRPVIHPQQDLNGIESMHYRSYGETQEYLRGRDIFMPTEFLHGLYDGGHGAGLWDYWEMMREHPRSGGGFLWVLADEGLVRTDQDGRVDTVGNYAADGIVGPHHEREGSFFAVQEIWSPVQVWPASADGNSAEATRAPLPAGFAGELVVENRYDFTPLNQCRFEWRLGQFPPPGANDAEVRTMAEGKIDGPAVAPQAQGRVRLPLPANWRQADVLYVTARAPGGRSLWTWSWPTKPVSASTPNVAPTRPAPASIALQESATEWRIQTATVAYRFDKTTGSLLGVQRGDQTIPLAGPLFVAARRGDRSVDGWLDPEAGPGVDRVYQPIPDIRELTKLEVTSDEQGARVHAEYFGHLRSIDWHISPDGRARLDYTYRFDGVVELMGLHFEFPEEAVASKRWLGRGPYRVWQNRLHGTVLGVWENDYNDSIPGESFIYPEFKGYFDGWRWARFRTQHGPLTLRNGTPNSYLGVFTPRDGRDALLFTLPQTGLGVFDVIPAVRNKVNATDLVGPSSQAQRVSGERRGSLEILFE